MKKINHKFRKEWLSKQIGNLLEDEKLGLDSEFSEITKLTPTSFQIRIKYNNTNESVYYVLKLSEMQ